MQRFIPSFSLPRAGRALGLLAALAAVAVVSGCARNSASGSVYSYGQAQQEQIVRTGTVIAVRPVTIQQEKGSGIGMVAGGALGGVAGNAIGGGTGRTIATVGGVILGGLLGDSVEHQVGKTQGLEITVKLDNGETRVVAQAADVNIANGQRVRLISGGGPTRVVPM